MSFIEVCFIYNGRSMDISTLNMKEFEILRRCIYDFIPRTTNLCAPFGNSVINKKNYDLIKTYVHNIKWKNKDIVIVFKKYEIHENKKTQINLKNIIQQLTFKNVCFSK